MENSWIFFSYFVITLTDIQSAFTGCAISSGSWAKTCF